MFSDTSRYPEERRLATVLFADVQGFTSLAEQLDFETVSDLLKGLWGALDKVIESHGGYIDKHLGDGVMAIWGAPFSSEHDADHAVSAGLEMIRAVDEYCAGTTIRGAEKLKLRVGINTGLVFAGYIGTRREYTVLGDTVNVASRLEQNSEAGRVIIGENTLRMLHESFRVRRLAPMMAKGKTELVQPYIIDGSGPLSGRSHDSTSAFIAGKLVGRDDELNKLKFIFDRSREGSRPVMVLINGEAGLGKTRLLSEFGKYLEGSSPRVRVLSTRGMAKTAREPYSAFVRLLRNLLGIQDNESSLMAREKWVRGMERFVLSGDDPGISTADTALLNECFLLEASEHTGDDERLQSISAAAGRLLRMLNRQAATVVLVDDLQYADRESLQILSSMINDETEPCNLLFVSGARPEFLKANSQWHNFARVIHLSPLMLPAEEVRKIYPHLKQVADDVLDELGQQAEGNPFYLGELVKSYVPSNPAAETQELPAANLVPEAMRAAMQARLDSLSPEARTTALLASVVGRTFWVGAVLAAARSTVLPGAAQLVSVPNSVIERFIQGGLRQLVRAALAEPRSGTHFSDEQEYLFKNTAFCDVAYSLIPNRNRVQYHRAIAGWMTNRQDPIFEELALEHENKAGLASKVISSDLNDTTEIQ